MKIKFILMNPWLLFPAGRYFVKRGLFFVEYPAACCVDRNFEDFANLFNYAGFFLLVLEKSGT